MKTQNTNATIDLSKINVKPMEITTLDGNNLPMGLDLYKFTNQKEDLRPIMKGVFHQDGYKVASDFHILVALKEVYDEILEGKTIGKDGEEIKGRYPKWRTVIPNVDNIEGTTIDLNAFADFAKDAKKQMKENKEIKSNHFVVKIKDAYFKFELFGKFAEMMKKIKTSTIYIQDGVRAALAKAEENMGMIMPIMVDEKSAELLSVCEL